MIASLTSRAKLGMEENPWKKVVSRVDTKKEYFESHRVSCCCLSGTVSYSFGKVGWKTTTRGHITV